MKLHKRVPVVGLAQSDIQGAVWDAVDKHGLTAGELARILANLTATAATMCVRAERHGNTDKKADEA